MRCGFLLVAALGLTSCQLVASDGDACFNDGNCSAGLVCCDGACRSDCDGRDQRFRDGSPFTAMITVGVVSDLTPLVDFDGLTTRIDDGAETSFALTAATHFDKARPVGVFNDVALGNRRVSVTLTLANRPVMERHADLDVVADTAINLALSRICVDMSCPSTGVADSVCHGGRCVPSSCSSLDLASCGVAQCADDGDCAPATSCGVASCVDGLCVERPDDEQCGGETVCRLGAGCVLAQPQCTVDGDCHDYIDCTRDRCVSGRCLNAADDSLCGAASCEPFAKAADALSGCVPPPCDADTCRGSACEIAECIGGTCRTTALCQSGERCCGDVCSADCATPHACEGRVAGAVCRPSAGACDVAELCDGVSVDCPADAVVGAGEVCRPSAGACDVAELCTGVGPLCPGNDLIAVGTVCHPSVGACDPAESCTGASPACPIDLFASSSAVCRPAAGDCDEPETCTGSSFTCPSDALRSGQVCRPAVGPCDLDEVCASGPFCPADTFRSSAVTCRAAVDLCDRAEICTGSAAGCPGDGKQANGFVCRAGSQLCEANALCDGVTDVCPANTVKPANTVCRALSGACDLEDRCNGSSIACPDGVQSGTQCDPGSVCTNPAACNGVSHDCPSGGNVGDGTPCYCQEGGCLVCCSGACGGGGCGGPSGDGG